MIDRLDWIHVSDFHFRGEGDQFSESVACEALPDDIQSRTEPSHPFHFVLVTGDIAQSGKANEYGQTKAVLGAGLAPRATTKRPTFPSRLQSALE